MLDDSRVNTHQENLVRYLQKMMKMIFHHMGRQAEMRLKKGIEYFIYLTYNETCIKPWSSCPKPELCRLKVLVELLKMLNVWFRAR